MYLCIDCGQDLTYHSAQTSIHMHTCTVLVYTHTYMKNAVTTYPVLPSDTDRVLRAYGYMSHI